MNERINELNREAQAFATRIWGEDEDYFNQWVETYKEKFAELIVRECMEQVWYTREDGINGNISQVIKDRITEHFGVEE